MCDLFYLFAQFLFLHLLKFGCTEALDSRLTCSHGNNAICAPGTARAGRPEGDERERDAIY